MQPPVRRDFGVGHVVHSEIFPKGKVSSCFKGRAQWTWKYVRHTAFLNPQKSCEKRGMVLQRQRLCKVALSDPRQDLLRGALLQRGSKIRRNSCSGEVCHPRCGKCWGRLSGKGRDVIAPRGTPPAYVRCDGFEKFAIRDISDDDSKTPCNNEWLLVLPFERHLQACSVTTALVMTEPDRENNWLSSGWDGFGNVKIHIEPIKCVEQSCTSEAMYRTHKVLWFDRRA